MNTGARWARAVLWALLGWGAAGCDDAATSAATRDAVVDPCGEAGCFECRLDTDCAPGQRCEARRCRVAAGVDATSGVDACGTDCPADAAVGADCGPGELSTDAGCAPDPRACQRNADCAPGWACDPDTRRCAPDQRRCETWGDCLSGEECVDGVCRRAPRTDQGPPTSDAGSDATQPDAALADVGLLEAGPTDVGPTDMMRPDASPLDAAPRPDLGQPDVGQPDAGLPDMMQPDAASTLDAAADLGEGPPPIGFDASTGPPDAAVLPLDAAVFPLDAAVLPLDAAVLPLDAAPDAEPALDAFVELPTPARGFYEYQRLPVGGLRELNRVAFHRSGRYALIAANSGPIWAVEWATGEATRFDPAGNDTIYWADVVFPRRGDTALLVGRALDRNGAETAVVFHFDGAAYDAGAPVAEVLQRSVAADRPGEAAVGIESPPGGGDPIVLVTRRVGQGYNAILRDYDPVARAWGPFVAATVTSAGCNDLTHTRDEFGGVGILIVCGVNGADHHFFATIGGVNEWRARPGERNTGNLSSAAAHASLDYALVIGWSGRRVHRFQAGVLRPTAQAPNYSRSGIWRVAFQPDGRRALIVGRAGVQPVRGTVIEYRHDLYRCPSTDNDCELTEVSIPGFDQAPYNADGNHNLNDAAFHPRCDAGFVVGGRTDFNGSTGHLIRFHIAGSPVCP